MSLGKMVSGGNEGSKEKQKRTESKVYSRKSFKGLNNISHASQNMELEDVNLSQQLIGSHPDAGSLNLNRSFMLRNHGQENSVRICLSSRSKGDMRQLRSRLRSELDLVRNLVKKIEAKDEKQTGSSTHLGRQLMHSDVSKVAELLETGPVHQLSVSVSENARGMSDVVEKEKRTPKANQFYRKSEFLLAKDKIPPAESNKKSKLNAKRVDGIESGQGFGLGKFSNKVIKDCRALLDRLMKHKHGWVFNHPVDAVGLGLHDYFDIIKHPMDLGTVKSRLETNWYKSPKDFAEDVRLTFQNAMTYNPEGHDVHIMAKDLLKTFEGKWASIEADFMRELKVTADKEVSLPTPRSVKAPRGTKKTSDRAKLVSDPIDPKPKSIHLPQPGRIPVPKKPKAKDPNKREMTYDEKQKLSTDLQNLPSEKLENVIQIIKKRNLSFSQQDEEIEVDIDSFDKETLWELDRFVTNYRKSLNKNKRKSILAFQERMEHEQDVQEKSATTVVVEEGPQEIKATEEKSTSVAPAQVENPGNNASRSSNSGSSSTDSGSSSTDSDSESSLGGRPDTKQSPKS